MARIDVVALKGLEIRTYPSGVDIKSDFMRIHIEINLLGQLVAEWRKANPNIDFEAYTQAPTN